MICGLPSTHFEATSIEHDDSLLAASIIASITALHSGFRGSADAFRAAAAELLIVQSAASAETLRLGLSEVQRLASTLETSPVLSDDYSRAAAILKATGERLQRIGGYGEFIATWPAPIAYELDEFVTSLSGRSGMAPNAQDALNQLRDASEVLVKVPAIILASQVLALGCEGAKDVRNTLASVSGGEWRRLAMISAASLERAEADGPFSSLVRLFASNSDFSLALEALAQARNRYLGHGAMRPNPSETAEIVAWFAAGRREDSRPPSVQVLGKTLADAIAIGVAARPWTSLQLQMLDEAGKPVDLMGAKSLASWLKDPRHVHHDGVMRPIRLVTTSDAPALELSPWLAARICSECKRRDVFVFDSVRSRKPWKSDAVDYARGHHLRLPSTEAPEFEDVLAGTQESEGRGDRLTSALALAELDRLQVDQRYLSPAYLRTGFSAFLAAHDRGIYWLTASAHCGKTTFAQGLTDETLRDGGIFGPFRAGYGGHIAAYFCKAEFREGLYSFLNALSDRLKIAFDLSERLDLEFPPAADVARAPDRKLAFLEWLDRWRSLAAPAPRSLLLVIDGVDEAVPPYDDQSILTCIPMAKDLSAGLFVLITSRRVGDEESPGWVGPLLAATGAVHRDVSLEDTAYKALLVDYGRRALDPARRNPKAFAPLIALLVSQAGARFVYFSFLIEQIRGGYSTSADVSKLGTGPEIYDKFIGQHLQYGYGPKLGELLVDLLGLLAAAELAHAWTFAEGSLIDETTGAAFEPVARNWNGLRLETLAECVYLDQPEDDGKPMFSVTFLEAVFILNRPVKKAGFRLSWDGRFSVE